MESSTMAAAAIPLYMNEISEIKSEVDSFMSLNDSSLSEQIEFILQDPINDRSTPPSALLQHSESPPSSRLDESGGSAQPVSKIDDEFQHELLTIKLEEIKEEQVDDDDQSSSFTSTSSYMEPISEVQLTTSVTSSCTINSSTVAIVAPPSPSTTPAPPPPLPLAAVSSPTSSVDVAEFHCIECPERFDNRELFEIHRSGHANNMKCAICNMVLKSLKNYEKHCLRCKPYECQICGRVVRFRPNFIKHMRVHTGQQSERHKYKCEVCHKEFMSFEYFKVHKKIHNENVNLTCEICGKVFSALASLRGHSKLHSGVKLHKCDVCGKGFGQRYNLKIHARTHTGDFPFECKICKKKLHTQSSLQTHMQTHQRDQHSQVTNTVKIEPIDTDLQQQQQTQAQFMTPTTTSSSDAAHVNSHFTLLEPKLEPFDDDEDAQMFESLPTTAEESSNESHDNNVIRNDVQNGPPPQGLYDHHHAQSKHREQLLLLQKLNKSSSALLMQSENEREERQLNSSSPSLMANSLAAIKSEPNLYSSGDNSVELLIKKEHNIFDDCSAPPSHNSPPTSKFDDHCSNYHHDLVDSNDLTHSLSYSNLFEPNSIPDSIPDEIYADENDFRSTLGVVSALHHHQPTSTTTDGDYIKKEWIYSSNGGYSIGSKYDVSGDNHVDDLRDAADFIYD